MAFSGSMGYTKGLTSILKNFLRKMKESLNQIEQIKSKMDLFSN